MTRAIVLDSTPLALIVHREGVPLADRCREWIAGHAAAGVPIIVPEIVDFEVRRELLRLRKTKALASLDAFNGARAGRLLPLNSKAMALAAELWARARQRGAPTADPHALDIDAILAAQVLTLGGDPASYVVATSNVSHLSQFIAAEEWSKV